LSLLQNPTALRHYETPQNRYHLIVKYRRAQAPGGAFFFTVVTFDRRKSLIHEARVLFSRLGRQGGIRVQDGNGDGMIGGGGGCWVLGQVCLGQRRRPVAPKPNLQTGL
jgi:hypothetical protein